MAGLSWNSCLLAAGGDCAGLGFLDDDGGVSNGMLFLDESDGCGLLLLASVGCGLLLFLLSSSLLSTIAPSVKSSNPDDQSGSVSSFGYSGLNNEELTTASLKCMQQQCNNV